MNMFSNISSQASGIGSSLGGWFKKEGEQKEGEEGEVKAESTSPKEASPPPATAETEPAEPPKAKVRPGKTRKAPKEKKEGDDDGHASDATESADSNPASDNEEEGAEGKAGFTSGFNVNMAAASARAATAKASMGGFFGSAFSSLIRSPIHLVSFRNKNPSQHKYRYKNQGLDSAEMRRRREEKRNQLRKQKKDHLLTERRNQTGVIETNWSNRKTTPKPFSFENRNAKTQIKKDQKIKKVLEDEKKQSEFYANPMPVSTGPIGVPAKASPNTTKTKPFNLKIDARGAFKKQILQRKMKEQKKEDCEKRNFQARSGAAVHRQPFMPEKSKKPLTDISGFALNTVKRAEERKKYDQHLKRKEAEFKMIRKQRDKRREAAQDEKAERQRKAAVHKARPVPQYKELKIKPSSTKPTVAIAPNFATDTRIRARHGSAGDA